MNNVDRFKQFLRDNGVASEFYTSYYKYKFNHKPASLDKHLRKLSGSPSKFITNTFMWSFDNDNTFKWARLSRKWRELLD